MAQLRSTGAIPSGPTGINHPTGQEYFEKGDLLITTMTSEAPATSVENVEEENELDFSSFEALLDSYDYDQPRRGETLAGLVLEITDDQVILDVGTKRDAIVPRSDLDRLDPNTLERIKPGAEISVVVLRPLSKDGELLVSINKALTIEDWDQASQLHESSDVIEVEVIGQNKGGVLVDFGRLRGFIPNSQLCEIPRGASSDRATDIKTKLISSKLMVKVIEVNQRRNRLVMSETAAQRSVRKESRWTSRLRGFRRYRERRSRTHPYFQTRLAACEPSQRSPDGWR
jgi:hypothetical protein